MMPSQRLASDCASERRRSIEAACFLADRLDLAAALVASDLSLSECIQRLVAWRELNELRMAGRFVEMRN